MTTRRKRKNSSIEEITKIPKTSCQDNCWLIYNAIRSRKDEKNELICEPFIKLPKKRNDQVYLLKISSSMDLQKIHHKIRCEDYLSVEDMIKDLNLIISNMKLLYSPTSNEYKQVIKFWNLINTVKKEIEYSVDTQSDDDNTDEEYDEQVDEEINSSINSYVDHSDENDVTNEDDDTKLVEDNQSEDDTKLVEDNQSEDEASMKVPVLKLKVVSNDAPIAKNKKMLIDNEETQINNLSEIEEHADTTISDDPSLARKPRKKCKKEPVLNVSLITDANILEDYFSFVINATDDDRSLSDIFKILPSIKKLPDYYSVIKEPIDLRMIARKLQNACYHNLEELNNDLLLMIQNAKTFNAPGSQIYKDACLLKKIILTKKSEIENARQVLIHVRSQRIREKTTSTNNVLSAVIAALDSDSDYEIVEKSSETAKSESSIKIEEKENKPNNDLRTLFDMIYNYKDSMNQSIIDPFLKLPNKRLYADYYLEIENPFSINRVQKKLENNQYCDLDALVEDLNLVFNNAMQYNREDSKIYNDADLLQQFMMTKKKKVPTATLR